MNWYHTEKMRWMKEMLEIYGFINRAHLIRKFKISSGQATIDFRKFDKLHGALWRYDSRKRAYVATQAQKLI
ncbi:MAG: hypothetical protein COB08_010135 [Rhodobacteraceae bacterium]|nr:hypothetical protein [Paracoccaceae bacterium]